MSHAWTDPFVTHPAQAVVAVDYDGTLAPIVDDPEQAVADPAAVAALARLAAELGRVAVVTGRPAEVAVRLGGLAAVPGVTVLGHYGLERWQDGRLEQPDAHPGVATARAALADLIAAAPPGTRLEDKGRSVAVHTRTAADPAGTLAALEAPVARLAADLGLEVVPGRFVLELRPPGVDKGQALLGLLAEVGARAVLFAGDDLGDLPAVAALRSTAAADVHAVVVCSDSPESPAALRDAADLVVDGPAGVAAVLTELADALSAPRGSPDGPRSP
jgi:trehalose 6-phosphate phosphatase